MAADVAGHYRFVLDDLREQRDRLKQDLAETEAAISALQRRVPAANVADMPLVPSYMSAAAESRPDAAVDYTKMSLRWAVLSYLSDVAKGPAGTGAITAALEARGMQSRSQSRFGNLVSAVLSNLRVKGEVQAVDDGLYQLTEAGRTMWAHIKTSPKFQMTMDGQGTSLLTESD
jgi:hypothetical protein